MNEEKLHQLSDKIITHWWNHEAPFEGSLMQAKIRYRKEFSAIIDAAREDEAGKYADIKRLLSYLAEFGGSIVSTNSLQPEWIEQARASGRLYVDENSLGYVWEPDIKRIPETPEEVEFFERWFPLELKLPKELENLDWLFKHKNERKAMTPKEKAEELVNGFATLDIQFPYIDTEDGNCIGSGYMTYHSAKQCALIAVEEIIAQLDEMIKPEYVSFWHGDNAGETEDGYFIKEYWEEVKTEIENL